MTHFDCTIQEASTTVGVKVMKTSRKMSSETVKLEERMFARRYRARIPNFIRELLQKKQFSFCPNAIMAQAFTAGGEYRLHYEFSYEDIRGVTFQTFLKRVTRWRIISTEIEVHLNPSTKKTTLKVTMKVLKPLGITSPMRLTEDIPQPEVTLKVTAVWEITKQFQ